MRFSTTLRLSLLPLALLVGCSGEETPADESKPAPDIVKSELERETEPQVSEAEKVKLVEGHNAFAFDLYDLIRVEEGAGENMFFSPTSITLALSMTYAGARGATASEMAEALHYDLDPEQLFAGFNWLDQELETRDDIAFQADELEASQDPSLAPPNRDHYRMHIVNSLWGEQTMSFQPGFLDTLALNYGAGVTLADFKGQPEVERVRINQWVSDETLGRIENLIPSGSIDPLTRAVLVNAIHLKLPWVDPFTVMNEDLSFTLLDGETVSSPAIATLETCKYGEQDDGLQVVSIPLEGHQVEVLIMAPPVGQLNAFEAELPKKTIAGIYDTLETREVNLRMPKFSFTSDSISLRKKLEALGMTTAFTDSADFNGITTDEPLHIGDVFHKAMIGVDEKGVEAAAATAVVFKGNATPEEPVNFDVDRPFFIGLVDAPTKALLFAGHIVEPAQ